MKYIEYNEKIDDAVEYIKSGELVIFPTETVYGIGANALNSNAVNKIFETKGRKNDNPLIVHISNYDMLKKLVKNISKLEENLINSFWPGPLTIIFEKSNLIPYEVTAGLNTVGIRMPDNSVALELIERSGLPIAAPSANISGKPSGTNIDAIVTDFSDTNVILIKSDESEIGIESTVIKIINNEIVILRPGYITEKDLSEFANVKVSKNILNKPSESEVVESPGMKYRHYAPNCKCVLVEGDEKEFTEKILKDIEQNGYKHAIILNHNSNYEITGEYIENISFGEHYIDISKNMYSILRDLNNKNIDIVYIQSVEKNGLGLAIYNRLIRACEYNIL